MTTPEGKIANGAQSNLFRLLKWKYSPTLLLSGANILCSVAFQLGALYKLGVGTRSDLYYASIVVPTVLFTLAFGALNNVLIPMFVEAKARGRDEEIALFWNCLLLTTMGGLILLAVIYVPVLAAFPIIFHKLSWIDLRQVGGILLAFSLYQVCYLALSTKNCFLYAEGRALFAQMGVFCGWFVSLLGLWRLGDIRNLGQIPLYLVAGNVVALLFPNLGERIFSYRLGFLRHHVALLAARSLPVAAGTSAGWVEPAIDGVIASGLKQGSLTIYYFFARAMFYAATAVFSGYIQPVTKHLAELAGTNRHAELRHQTRKVLLNAALLSLGIMGLGLVLLLFLGTLRITVLRSSVLALGENLPVFVLLLGYLFGTLGYSVYSNSLYVLRRERVFLMASVCAFPVGIGLKVLAARLFGLKGLAVGTSLYWVMFAMVLAFCFSWVVQKRETAGPPSTLSPSHEKTEVGLLPRKLQHGD